MTKTKHLRIRPIFLLLAIVFFISACNRNIVYSQYHSFPENEWRLNDRAVFDLEITDVQTLNNISLMVRHADTYPYNNLFLFVTTAYPDGKVITDTMEVILANQKGEWQGSGAGDIYDVKVPIKKNVRFVLPGKYKFTFEQGMRVDPLPMIMDFGLEIEKSK